MLVYQRVVLKQPLFVKTRHVICQAPLREPGHELGVTSGPTWKRPQGIAMFIGEKDDSTVFIGKNIGGKKYIYIYIHREKWEKDDSTH